MKRECQRRHYASHKEELQRKSREFHRQLRVNNRTFASSENSVVKVEGQKSKQHAPKGAEAHSPGQRPEVKSHQKQCAL